MVFRNTAGIDLVASISMAPTCPIIRKTKLFSGCHFQNSGLITAQRATLDEKSIPTLHAFIQQNNFIYLLRSAAHSL